MKLLKKIAAVIGVLVLVFVIVGLVLPTTYTVSSTVTIKADQATVHALVADLEAWPDWQPWTENDPTIVVTRGSQATGVGAHQSWTGDSGDGELTFTQSDPLVGVTYDMTFDQKYKSVGSISHEDAGEGQTKVTWFMEGDTGTPVIGGYFAKLMPGLIQPMFDRGLEKLKGVAEAEAPAHEAADPVDSAGQG